MPDNADNDLLNTPAKNHPKFYPKQLTPSKKPRLLFLIGKLKRWTYIIMHITMERKGGTLMLRNF